MKVRTSLFVGCCFAVSTYLSAQTPKINADKVSGEAPLTVKFSYNGESPAAWNFGDGTVQNGSSPEHTFDRPGVYKISLKVNEKDSAQTEINVLGDQDRVFEAAQVSDTTIIVPNVFTPNHDNINEQLKIVSSGKYFLSLKVFTRAGIMIYKTMAKTIEWDGRMDSGEMLQPGIYFYIVEMPESTPPVKKKGFFYVFN
jgi:gliding motility-associated-like protein